MKDDLMNVGSQNSSGVNTVDDYNEKGVPDIADLNNSVSRFSEETCQGKIIVSIKFTSNCVITLMLISLSYCEGS